ncbi:MarR family transcriptional regulator [Streptomyces sp. NPDC002690]
MARLNTDPVSTDEIHAVLTAPDLLISAKAIWIYLRIVTDPQSQKAISDALRMDPATVSRLVRALETEGLARKVHGVWLSEVPR